MSLFNRLLLLSHILAGTVALIMAPLAMASVKGALAHRRWGRIYFWAMAWIFSTALVLLCTYKFNFFLLPISFLSFYPAFTGYRCLYQKGGGSDNPRGKIGDWIACAFVALAGMSFVVWGADGALYQQRSSYPPGFHTLGMVGGFTLLIFTCVDLRRFLSPSSEPKWWLVYHLRRMLTSYIAAVTAFAVTALGPHVPGRFQWIIWTAPTATIVPMIVFYARHFRFKPVSAESHALRRTGVELENDTPGGIREF